MTAPGALDASGLDLIDLEVEGMTCAACAARIEKKLNRLDGVTATVNYATEKASVRFDGDRLSPSDLIATIESIGYGAHVPTPVTTDEGDDGRNPVGLRLAVAAVLGTPVLLLSMIPALQFDAWQWVALVLATPVATWAAWPFHRTALKNARHLEASMDTLVSVGVTAAYLWSLWALVFTEAGDVGTEMDMSMDMGGGSGGDHHLYLEVASTTVALILLGRWFEARSKRRAGGALRALLQRGADEAAVLDADGTERRVAAADLYLGDRFVVRPGERIATDGVVVEGASAIDTSLITGESVPVDVAVGDAVTGATINVDGRLVVRATRVGADTTLARMARLVEQAQSGKAPVQRLADRVAGVFVPAVVLLAIGTLVGWLIATGSIDEAVRPAMAVLIIACPCALGLATPTALLVGTGRGAQLGILIRGPEVLEQTRRVDTVVLDKTGTITTGEMRVIEVSGAAGATSPGDTSPGDTSLGDTSLGDAVLRLAAAVEQGSEHPIAKAIVRAAREQGLSVPPVDGFRNTPGHGAVGTVEAHTVAVQRAGTGTRSDAAATQVDVLVDDVVVGTISLADTVKPTSPAGIASFRALGLRPVLLTGDNPSTAAAVAAEVGIAPDDVFAEVTPAGKLEVVTRLQHDGRVVAMVGDGVNDAAALAQADLGVAMGSGTDVAIEASDLTLVRAELPAAADAVRLSRRTLATIKGNLFWAFAYNVAALPIAASGLLSPVVASAAMAGSSIFVVSNSLRLRRFRPTVTATS